MKWEAEWPMNQALRGKKVVRGSATKVFAEIAPEWVAQITVQGTKSSDDDAMIRHILQTLETTSDPDGYRPAVRAIKLRYFWPPQL